ncbi:DUF632 domain-containing protein/DUF630 domain-containing protein [Cephalotus follicularis]|uniref:DUF632 domain-containing protein/DUF630 domain-containing protein n=1 Tax=Cephalotus follicularis TaxID=3775 RepID=A0A1Q3BWV7_CEPFO|nr:DUF632 domain-containing protein/DUF630 domain-containing protein [Cephalotus follicularis]
MGISSSKLDEDKALQLCRERKKFIRQALDGRCSLATAHVMYIQSLRNTGTALRKFFELEAAIESSLYTSTAATPEPLVLTEKSISQFTFSSPTLSQPVDATENLSPSSSSPRSSQFHANHMRFGSFSSQKVEEKPPLHVTGTITTSSTPENATPRSTETLEALPFEASMPSRTPAWDYFNFFHPIDHQFSFQEGKGVNQGLENADDIRRLREEEGVPELEDEEEKASFHEGRESQDSEDEFDEPPTDTLVRSFENLNRVHDRGVATSSPTVPSAGSVASEADFLNGEKSKSPDFSPLRSKPSAVTAPSDAQKTPVKEDCIGNKVAPKDIFSSMKDIEFLFIKASEAGKEVPRMLEANKLHFRPIITGKESGSVASKFLNACFSCRQDPSQVQEEPAQTVVKYLTWHRTASSRSSSSRNPLGINSKDEIEDLSNNLVENFCMISGSHASTLDRLYAWERKLYDEVKASEMVRRDYDSKCKILRQLESRGDSAHKIDKTRAVVKDLHSRIRVAIHRIDSISKRIEELRDKELQPQLEELIAGLSRMWEVMFECHKLQFHIISVAYNNGSTKVSVETESHRQFTMHLENELSSLSSSFTKWINALKSYLQAINEWLFKCVSVQQNSSKRKRRPQPPPLRNFGPPIYVTCGVWLDILDTLHKKEDADVNSIESLAAEITRFLPRQEKKPGKSGYHPYSNHANENVLRDEPLEDWISGFDHFRSRLAMFLCQLYKYAEASVTKYAELEKDIQDAKGNYDEYLKALREAKSNNDQLKSQSKVI